MPDERVPHLEFFGEIIHHAYGVIELVDRPETKNVEGAFIQLAGQPAKKAKRTR